MTDSRLQELERAWEASGSVEDEAAYLRERVRVGDLTQERLELAARLGYLLPGLSAGPQPHAKTSLQEQVREALDRLDDSGRQSAVIYMSQLADLIADASTFRDWNTAQSLQSLRHSIETWIDHGGREAAAVVARRLRDTSPYKEIEEPPTHPEYRRLRTALDLRYWPGWAIVDFAEPIDSTSYAFAAAEAGLSHDKHQELIRRCVRQTVLAKRV